jgi:hypothetical protein
VLLAPGEEPACRSATSWGADFRIAFSLADPSRISRLYAQLLVPGFLDRKLDGLDRYFQNAEIVCSRPVRSTILVKTSVLHFFCSNNLHCKCHMQEI